MEKITSSRKTARAAGLLYFIIVLTTLYAHIYVPSQIFVRGDAVATANNILSHEFLFRSCVVAGMLEATVLLFLVLKLYRLLKEVNSVSARSMVALAVVQIPISFVLGIFKLTALMVLSNEAPQLVSARQLPDLAMLFLQITMYGNTILSLIGGLWLFPFGLLLYRSRFIPRLFGVLAVMAAAGYLLGSLVTLLLPEYALPAILAFVFFGLGEIPVMLWLLIKGVKEHVSIEIIAETKTPARSPAVTIEEYSD